MKTKRFFIRLFNYEYWPMWAFYTPLIPYLLFKGIKNRNLFFYSNVNRKMDDFGGMFFDSKLVVDSKIPQKYRPFTITLPTNVNLGSLETPNHFPIILKPDNAERGKGIFKIQNHEEWEKFSSHKFSCTYLIQEFVDKPLELGVFITFDAVERAYKVLSITEKKYFSVEGDGKSNIHELILKQKRGLVFYDEIKEKSNYSFDFIPQKGEILVLHQQGNHCKGTQFVDVSYKINQKIHSTIGEWLKELEVFEYGRFDLKCDSIEDLETEQGLAKVKIIEFNGIAAEPIHIYDSRIGYFNSLKIFKKHWNYLFQLSKLRKEEGIAPHSSKKTIEKFWQKMA